MALTSDTIPALLTHHAAAYPHEVVLRHKHRGIWMSVTWSDLASRVRRIGTALLARGMGQGDVVAILSGTRYEAVDADLGAMAIGCVSACLDPREEPARLEQVLRDAACGLLFVENEEQLDTALLLRDRCPTLRHIVIFDMKGLHGLDDPMCESVEVFLADGQAHDTAHPASWEAAIAAVTPLSAASLVPSAESAVRLNHQDLLQLSARVADQLGQHVGDERVAFLPMGGSLERIIGLYAALCTRTISNYLENAATLIENLREIQPTVLAAPLSVWQQFQKRVTDDAANATALQHALFNWAIRSGESAPTGLAARIARALVLRSVRRNMGLIRLRIACVGTASPPPDLTRWYGALGLTLTRLDALAVRDVADAGKHVVLLDELTCAA